MARFAGMRSHATVPPRTWLRALRWIVTALVVTVVAPSAASGRTVGAWDAVVLVAGARAERGVEVPAASRAAQGARVSVAARGDAPGLASSWLRASVRAGPVGDAEPASRRGVPLYLRNCALLR